MCDRIRSIQVRQGKCNSAEFIDSHMRDRSLRTLTCMDRDWFASLYTQFCKEYGKPARQIIKFAKCVLFQSTVTVFMDESGMVSSVVVSESRDCICCDIRVDRHTDAVLTVARVCVQIGDLC